MDALQHIQMSIATEMQRYRVLFDSMLQTDRPLLSQVLPIVAQRKGKMMRPMLTILCSKLVGDVTDKTLYTAATFEFLHTASLIHDDVVDESDKRRGQDSLNIAFGNKVAVLVGDYLLANSLHCAAETESPRLVSFVSKTAKRLAAGELLQLDNVARSKISENVYFDIIKDKTASLFAYCAEAGVLTSTDDSVAAEKLHQFGELIGICFQIRDDIFDYKNDANIGKPTGNDMKEGKLTLPAIYALRTVEDEEMLNIAQKVKRQQATDEEITKLVDFTERNGGIEYALKIMYEYADKAKELLDYFPDSHAKESLMAYVDFVVERTT